MNSRVVITGVGLATPLGNVVETFSHELFSGRSSIDQCEYDGETFAVGRVVEPLDIKDFKRFIHRKHWINDTIVRCLHLILDEIKVFEITRFDCSCVNDFDTQISRTTGQDDFWVQIVVV